MVAQEEDLAGTVQELLENEDARRRLSVAAKAYGRSQSESLERIFEALRPLLAQAGKPERDT